MMTLQQQLHFQNWFHSLLELEIPSIEIFSIPTMPVPGSCPLGLSHTGLRGLLGDLLGLRPRLILSVQRKTKSQNKSHFSNVKKAFSPKVLELRQLRYHVKTTHERCGPFSLVVLSQRRGQVTTLSGQTLSETLSSKASAKHIPVS